MSRTSRPEPSEWQVDEKTGQRFRMIGNVKEYEMMVSIGGTMIPESQVEAFNARNKAAADARREAERRAATEQRPQRNCPFADGMNTTCSREKCALYMGDGCTLARWNAAKVTEGLQCPLSKYKAKCREDCALYKNGCTLTAIKTNRESEEK